MNTHILSAIAIADFRERIRRPGFLAILFGAIVLGYFAAGPASSRYALFQLGEYRGVYDSQYIGAVVALMGSIWLFTAGFYVIKNAISRDEASGVGQILAATPLDKKTYLLGKFLSNYMVLGTMVGVLALTALVMLVVRGEAHSVNLIALWLPFLLFTLPALALAAALAVLFETRPRLKGGLGNIVWFFLSFILFMSTMVGVRSGTFPVDLFGTSAVAPSMRQDILDQHPDADDPRMIIGIISRNEQPDRFTWVSGPNLSPAMVASRLALIPLAMCIALLPALWFTRFDPSRARRKHKADESKKATVASIPQSSPEVSAVATPPPAHSVRTLTPATRGNRIVGLILGEWRTLTSHLPLWWIVIAILLVVAGALVPESVAVGFLLPAAWAWPVLIWSKLGTQQYEYNVHTLLGSAPGIRRRLAAEWAAGALLTALAGSGVLMKIVISGDQSSALSWVAGLIFIPSLALALGTLSRSARLFQAVYLMLLYIMLSGEKALDFMGVYHGEGLTPAAVGVAATAFLAVTFIAQEIRQRQR